LNTIKLINRISQHFSMAIYGNSGFLAQHSPNFLDLGQIAEKSTRATCPSCRYRGSRFVLGVGGLCCVSD
jgi:hypothetical protein